MSNESNPLVVRLHLQSYWLIEIIKAYRRSRLNLYIWALHTICKTFIKICVSYTNIISYIYSKCSVLKPFHAFLFLWTAICKNELRDVAKITRCLSFHVYNDVYVTDETPLTFIQRFRILQAYYTLKVAFLLCFLPLNTLNPIEW